MSDERIVRYTAEQLGEMIRRGDTRTDWDRVLNMTDEEIEANIDREDEGYFDLSQGYAASGPPVPRAEPGGGPGSAPAMTPVPADVVAWFRQRHPDDYAARIGDVLRDFVARQERERRQAS